MRCLILRPLFSLRNSSGSRIPPPQQAPTTFRWIDFRSRKIRMSSTWVTRPCRPGLDRIAKSRPIRCGLVSPPTAHRQSAANADTFNVWSVSLPTTSSSPHHRRPSAGSTGCASRRRSRRVASSTTTARLRRQHYFTAFYYDIPQLAGRPLMRAPGAPCGATTPARHPVDQVYAGIAEPTARVHRHLEPLTRQQQALRMSSPYDVDPSATSTDVNSTRRSRRHALRLCAPGRVPDSSAPGFRLCQQLVKPSRAPAVTTPPANHGKSAPAPH